MKILSPAKLNLFLHVRSKRRDGYHAIETLFERISLADRLTLEPARSGVRVVSSLKNLPRGPKNIAYRAAKLLKDEFRLPQGVTIRIQKNIPVSAGLGGGSSNAATVLLGLNRLWKLGLSRKTLMCLGARLGSDVPFFLLETPFALGTGRGEKIQKILAPRVKIWHCVVKPSFGISTKKAYQQWARAPRPYKLPSLTPKKTDVRMLLHSIRKGRRETLTKLLTNSLEVALNKRVGTILKIKEALSRQGALGCLMSGSGSAVFGIYPSKNSALKAARVLRQNKRWRVFVVSTF